MHTTGRFCIWETREKIILFAKKNVLLQPGQCFFLTLDILHVFFPAPLFLPRQMINICSTNHLLFGWCLVSVKCWIICRVFSSIRCLPQAYLGNNKPHIKLLMWLFTLMGQIINVVWYIHYKIHKCVVFTCQSYFYSLLDRRVNGFVLLF